MNFSSHLYAFCLPIILFSYWAIVGYAVLGLLRSRRYTLQNLLLAPVVGFALTLLIVFWLNRAGLPIHDFARVLAFVLLIASSVFFYWKKPLFPTKYYLPFVGIFLLALGLVGSPFLKFGFDWVSYANDDMANYALGATRFLNHGFF